MVTAAVALSAVEPSLRVFGNSTSSVAGSEISTALGGVGQPGWRSWGIGMEEVKGPEMKLGGEGANEGRRGVMEDKGAMVVGTGPGM